jgi:hypothetical protein
MDHMIMPVSRILQHRKTDQIKQRVNQYPVQMPVRAEQMTKLPEKIHTLFSPRQQPRIYTLKFQLLRALRPNDEYYSSVFDVSSVSLLNCSGIFL